MNIQRKKSRAEELDALLKECVKIDRENKSKAASYWSEFSDKEMWRQLNPPDGKYKSLKDYAERALGKDYQWVWRQRILESERAKNPQIKNVSEAMETRKSVMPTRKPSAKEPEETKKPEPKVEKLQKDKTGCDIPRNLQEFWNRNEEIDHLLRMLRQIKSAVEKGRETNDRLFRKIDTQGILSRLISCEEEINAAKSHAVCPSCNGIFNDNCETCKGRGTLSKFHWGLVPEEIRNLRESNENEN